MALITAAPLPGGGIAVSLPGRPPLRVEVPGPGRLIRAEVSRDTVTVAEASPEAHAWFSEVLGAEIRLVHLDEPAHRRPDPEYSRPGDMVSLADGYPLLLTTTASLDALNDLIAAGDHPHEGPLPMNRFRPNVVIDSHRGLGRGRLAADRHRGCALLRGEVLRPLRDHHHRPAHRRARQGAAAHPGPAPAGRQGAALRPESDSGRDRGDPGRGPRQDPRLRTAGPRGKVSTHGGDQGSPAVAAQPVVARHRPARGVGDARRGGAAGRGGARAGWAAGALADASLQREVKAQHAERRATPATVGGGAPGAAVHR